MTIKELSQLYYLNREIEQKQERLAELKSVAYKITPTITGMPHCAGVSDKVGQSVADIADLEALISLKMQECWHELNRLNRYIESIDDSLTRQIFSLRFINGLRWEQVADSIGGISAECARQICSRYIRTHETCHTSHDTKQYN